MGQEKLRAKVKKEREELGKKEEALLMRENQLKEQVLIPRVLRGWYAKSGRGIAVTRYGGDRKKSVVVTQW